MNCQGSRGRVPRNPSRSPRAGSNAVDYSFTIFCGKFFLASHVEFDTSVDKISFGQFIAMFVSQTFLFDYFCRLFV